VLDNAKVFHRISLSHRVDSSRLRLRPFSLFTGWFMTLHVDVARGRNVVARWCTLAEQRLEYLTDLFETGRWRRFHTERDFLENIQEAKAAVETWRALATREAALDNTSVDLSWLGRPRTTPPRGDRFRERVQLYQPQPAPTAIEPPRDIEALAALASLPIAADEAPSAPEAPTVDQAVLPTLDLDVMKQRYPLLRHAL
jgi:uncharacterized repeat protein (TIGR03809 family)